MKKQKKIYYDDAYYAWQKKAGEYGANQDTWMYKPYINKNSVVLDFGCGGGYILEKLICKEKYGVDINPVARNEARRRGIKVFPTIKSLPQDIKFDIIISHHTLEHVDNPFEMLKKLHQKIKPHGKLVLVVP